MILRAHHLLCIRNFKGKGYSQEFIDNFYSIIGRLRKEKIKIVNSVDAVCEKCPHNNEGMCRKKRDSQEKVTLLDNSVIKAAKINLTNEYSYSELKELVNDIKASRFCKDCEWKVFCK